MKGSLFSSEYAFYVTTKDSMHKMALVKRWSRTSVVFKPFTSECAHIGCWGSVSLWIITRFIISLHVVSCMTVNEESLRFITGQREERKKITDQLVSPSQQQNNRRYNSGLKVKNTTGKEHV